MQKVEPPSSNFRKRLSVGVLIFAGYPILAIVLVLAAINDLLPTDYYGRPTIPSMIAFYIILSVPLIFLIRCFAPLFSKTIREKVAKHKWIDALWAIYSLIFFLGIFFPSSGHLNPKSKFMRDWRTKTVLNQVYTGILAYETEYGKPPVSSSTRALIKTLEGDNPRQLAFINFKGWETNSLGEPIDGYETPIRISVDPKNPTVQSAGLDKIWNTPDDVKGETFQ